MSEHTRDHWHVGQQVYIRDVNERRLNRREGGLPPVGTVTKVARKLLTVANEFGLEQTYEIATGRRNDAFRHGWVQTFEDFESAMEQVTLLRRLEAAGLEVRLGHKAPSNETLRSILSILEASR